MRGSEQFGIQNSFVAQFRLFEDLRFEQELDEFLRALALHHQFAALVKNHVGFFGFEREPRIRHLRGFQWRARKAASSADACSSVSLQV